MAGVTSDGITNNLGAPTVGVNYPIQTEGYGGFAPVVTSTQYFNGANFHPATTHDYTAPDGIHNTAQFFYAESPLTRQSMTDNAGAVRQYRLVGGGVTIAYAGSEFKRGGQVLLWTNTSAHPFWDDQSLTKLLQEPMAVRAAASRRGEAISYMPVTVEEFQYNSMNNWCYPDDTFEINAPRVTNVIFITGAEPNQSWTFDCALHWEVIGTGLSRTSSHNDPIGYAAVVSNRPTMISTKEPEQQEKDWLKGAMHTLHTVISHPLARAAFSTVGGLLGGPPGALAGAGIDYTMDRGARYIEMTRPGPIVEEVDD